MLTRQLVNMVADEEHDCRMRSNDGGGAVEDVIVSDCNDDVVDSVGDNDKPGDVDEVFHI
jgi:hypothetical protein